MMLRVWHYYYKLDKFSLTFLRLEGIMCTSLVISLCVEGVSSRALYHKLLPVSKRAHFGKQIWEVCAEGYGVHYLLELDIEYLLFTNWGILKFTQFIDSLSPLSEVTLFLFLFDAAATSLCSVSF